MDGSNWGDLGLVVFVVCMTGTIIILSVRENEQRRALQKVEWQRSILIDRLRELGVLVKFSKSELTELSFKYTLTARQMLSEHHYPSAWNLEQQIQHENYEAMQKVLEEMIDQGLSGDIEFQYLYEEELRFMDEVDDDWGEEDNQRPIFSGDSGVLYVDGKKVAEVEDWELRISDDEAPDNENGVDPGKAIV